MEKLIEAALAMRKRAHAPYSNYEVGAAVMTADGSVIGGCNVESSSHGLTCCAERIALYRAISEGHNAFTALAVATENCGPPCGACRQVIWDLCNDIPVYITDSKGNLKETSSKALLPDAFGHDHLL
jgi:cytidine deaminase